MTARKPLRAFCVWCTRNYHFMTNSALIPAICSAMSLPYMAGVDAPEWVHILPAGEQISTVDGRGPYLVGDAHQIIANSFARMPHIIIDENHSTDKAANQGHEAPAHGYVVEMASRADGVWGKVKWNASGKALMANQSYWGLSPVLMHPKGSKAVHSIARVSLTNQPNLCGLATLNSEINMSLPAIAKALGLKEDASEGDVLAGIAKLTKKDSGASEANASLNAVATALGLKEGARDDEIIAAAQSVGVSDNEVIASLQSELATTATSLNALQESVSRDKAEVFVDGAIKAGRVGVKPMRDRYVSMHMADAPGTEELISAMPPIAGETLTGDVPGGEQVAELNAAQDLVVTALGIDAEAFQKTLAAQSA